MTIRKSVLVLTAGLFAALLLAAPPAEAKRAKDLNDAQLKLLFSGSKVEATGEYCAFAYDTGEPTLKFVFDTDGTFTVDHVCEMGMSSHSGEDTGKWWVEDDQLCIQFENSVTTSYLPTHENCWPVKHGRFQFGLYAGGSAFWNLSFSHPKYSSKENLLAALDKLSPQGATAAVPVTLPPAEYKPLPVGTKIKYSDRKYEVTRTDGHLTVFKGFKGGKLLWVTTYGLFGKIGDNAFVFSTTGVPIAYDITNENRKKLETFWPLKVNKETSYQLTELDTGSSAGSPHQTWTIRLKVQKTEAINIAGYQYGTFVIDEQAKSDRNMSFVSRKWYHPESGLNSPII